MEFRPTEPCDDCVDGFCTMNCSPVKGKFVDWSGWRPAATAPKDGEHILVCIGGYDNYWTFNQSPPVVVHYWSNPGEEGFYPSNGIVEGSYNDVPVNFGWWKPLAGTEPREYSQKPQ